MGKTYKDKAKHLEKRFWDDFYKDPCNWSYLKYFVKYNPKEHLSIYRKIPRKHRDKLFNYDLYNKHPKWWNKIYHIRPQRRTTKKYIHNYVYSKPYSKKEPSKTYKKPTEYYW